MKLREKLSAIFFKKEKKEPPIIAASFDAASRSREAAKHWAGADSLAADAALSPDVRRTIIARARYEAANNGYLCGILNTFADDVVGTGPRLQLSIANTNSKWSTEQEAYLENREKRWKKWTDAVGLSTILTIARRSKAQDGEVFIRKVINPKLPNPVKLDLTLYEAEQVGSSTMIMTPEYHSNGTPKEVDGIIYDPNGNPSSYRFWTIHPGSTGIANSIIGDSYTVNARHVIHYANIVRPGQHRGLPEIASTLPIFNDLRRFTGAVLAAAETAAEISFLLHTDRIPDEDNENITPGLIVEFQRNSGVTLPEGWHVTQLKAEQPTSNHTDFVRTKIREAARALSMPLNVALGDSSEYNYASGRLDHQVYFRVIKKERTMIEHVILDDIIREWENFDQLIHPEDYPDNITVEHAWMWDGFAHVDPAKEANAQQIRLNSKTTTLAEECGADGKDYIRVIRQRAKEECIEREIRKKYGLPDSLDNITKGYDEDDK